MIYLDLFLGFLQIGLFSIGGGHASIPVVKGVVDSYGWLTEAEFTDMITISEMTPGPFAVNSATFIGVKTGGIAGGIIATISFFLPAFVIALTLYTLIKKLGKLKAVKGFMSGVKPCVSGLIGGAGIIIVISALFGASSAENFSILNFDFISFFIAAICFLIIKKAKINSVLIIFIGGIAGLLTYFIGI